MRDSNRDFLTTRVAPPRAAPRARACRRAARVLAADCRQTLGRQAGVHRDDTLLRSDDRGLFAGYGCI